MRNKPNFILDTVLGHSDGPGKALGFTNEAPQIAW